MPFSLEALAFVFLPLAAWRLAFMLVAEEGPFEVFDALRFQVHDTTFENLLSCVKCTSVWTSAGLLLAWHFVPGQWLIMILAMSALAILINNIMEATSA